MEHHHSEHYCHQHIDSDQRFKTLWRVLILTSLYFVAEVVGGYMTGSLALLADAGHMFADVGAIGLALFASWFSTHPATPQKTFGYHRIEILAALFNGLVLACVSFGIIFEASQRWSHPPEIKAGWMLIVAVGGLIVNILCAFQLHKGHDSDLNLKAAYLHVIGDLLGSVGAIVASLLIIFQGFYVADPIFSILIAVLVLYSAVHLVMEAVNILLEGSPTHINVANVKAALLGLGGILSVHDLHVWSITSGKDALAAHVVVEKEAFNAQTLSAIQECLKEKFGLSHVTLQLEPPDFEEDQVHC